MKVFSVVLAITAARLAAQTPTVMIMPRSPIVANDFTASGKETVLRRGAVLGAPILGYLLGPGSIEIHTIVGTVASAQLGPALVVPDNSRRLYLPPRQHYALVEQDGDQPISLWALHKAAASGAKQPSTVIAGAVAHPDIVAFSPRGSAVIFYSLAMDQLQIVAGLPENPSVTNQLSTASLGELSGMALSDDASLVIAVSADGKLMLADGPRWQPLPGGYKPTAWAFVPNTHDLVLSDSTQKVVVLMRRVNETSGVTQVLAEGVQADRLAATKDGELMLAAGSSQANLWTIELKTGTVTPLKESTTVNSLSPLRDGHTFLLSGSPILSLLRLGDSLDSPAIAAGSQEVRIQP